MIDALIGKGNDGKRIENEDIEQDEMEKIDSQSSRQRNAEILGCDINWKSEVRSNELKEPINFFTQSFIDKIWQQTCLRHTLMERR